MNYLGKYIVLGVSLIFWSPQLFCIHYDEQKCSEFRENLNRIVEIAGESLSPHKAELSQIVRKLIKQGANPNIRTTDHFGNSVSAMHLAAATGDTDLVDFLSNQGANFDAVNSFGNTPLVWAARRGHQEVMMKLLALGAKQGKKAFVEGRGPHSILSAFYSKEANLAGEPWFTRVIRIGPSEEIRHILLHSSEDSLKPLINEPEAHGFVPLDVALVSGKKNVFMLLLEKGANPAKCRFNPRILEREKAARQINLNPSLYYLNYDYSRKHYFAILVPLSKSPGIPVEIIKYIINLLLLA